MSRSVKRGPTRPGVCVRAWCVCPPPARASSAAPGQAASATSQGWNEDNPAVAVLADRSDGRSFLPLVFFVTVLPSPLRAVLANRSDDRSLLGCSCYLCYHPLCAPCCRAGAQVVPGRGMPVGRGRGGVCCRGRSHGGENCDSCVSPLPPPPSARGFFLASPFGSWLRFVVIGWAHLGGDGVGPPPPVYWIYGIGVCMVWELISRLESSFALRHATPLLPPRPGWRLGAMVANRADGRDDDVGACAIKKHIYKIDGWLS